MAFFFFFSILQVTMILYWLFSAFSLIFIPLLFWIHFQVFFPIFFLLLKYYTNFLKLRFNILKLRVIFGTRVMLEKSCLWHSKILIKTSNLLAHSAAGNWNKPVLWLLIFGGHSTHPIKSAFNPTLVWVRYLFRKDIASYLLVHQNI